MSIQFWIIDSYIKNPMVNEYTDAPSMLSNLYLDPERLSVRDL